MTFFDEMNQLQDGTITNSCLFRHGYDLATFDPDLRYCH